jgi:hypothetical protein
VLFHVCSRSIYSVKLVSHLQKHVMMMTQWRAPASRATRLGLRPATVRLRSDRAYLAAILVLNVPDECDSNFIITFYNTYFVELE